MSTIPYSDSRIAKIGRWQDTGSGIWSGWGGSQLIFKVSGATSLTVNGNSVCAPGKVCVCECVIDNSPQDSLIQYFANNITFSGPSSVTFALPDTGEHTIILKTNGYNADIFNGLSRTVVTSIDVGTGTITSYTHGALQVQCVQDSWGAADADWPRLLRQDMFRTYQVATGGLKASDMDAQYNYAANGIAATDTTADIVITGFGVNDLNAGVSVASFQTSFLSVVDKIRAKQSCPIFLIQIPRNRINGAQYDQYGTAMQNIAAMRANVFYLTSQPIWPLLTWNADNLHLDAAGKLVMANYISQQILSTLKISWPFLHLPGIQYTGESVITTAHALRYKGAVSFGCKLKESDSTSALRIRSLGRTFTIDNG